MQEKPKDVLRPTDAEAVRLARTLLRSSRYGALAVIEPETGAPAASRVATATDIDGAPLILVSALSLHTAALIADKRCSLLLGEPGSGDPLAYPRLSVACEAERVERSDPLLQRVERRYLARQPKAKLYAGFADFSYFRLEPQRASLTGGFGKAYALTRDDLLTISAVNASLAATEQSAVAHMNADHAEAVSVYARAYAKAEPGRWQLTGIDLDGMDLALGDDVRRVFFPQPLASAADIRATLVRMAQEGRTILGL